MGWKNVRDHYKIDHIIQVTGKGICIGSPYIHDLIIIGLDGKILKGYDGPWSSNANLSRYMKEFKEDPDKLSELVASTDTFSKSLVVWTYKNGTVISKFCEEYGYPNVTHDGELMYDNVFFKTRAEAVAEGKKTYASEIRIREEILAQKQQELQEYEKDLETARLNLLRIDNIENQAERQKNNDK